MTALELILVVIATAVILPIIVYFCVKAGTLGYFRAKCMFENFKNKEN